jgi:hypothetical protein
VALAAVDLPLPDGLEAGLARLVVEQVAPLRKRHRIVAVTTRGLDAALRASPVALSTMGRGYDEDPAYFLTAAAAGRHAAQLLA